MTSPLNIKRYGHGIGVITINGQEILAVIGGSDGSSLFDSVELYNIETKEWEISNIRLNGSGRTNLQILQIKLADILSK